MFRKSHLLPTAPHLFDPRKQLTKADFKIFPWGTLITIRWSKTIQFRERIVEIPLPCIPRSKGAVINYWGGRAVFFWAPIWGGP